MVVKRKYELRELRKDMQVKVSQLSNVRDTCMILLDTELLPDNDVEGTLVYFGSGDTEEYTGWFQQEKAITPVYFDSEELEDGIVYDDIFIMAELVPTISGAARGKRLNSL